MQNTQSLISDLILILITRTFDFKLYSCERVLVSLSVSDSLSCFLTIIHKFKCDSRINGEWFR